MKLGFSLRIVDALHFIYIGFYLIWKIILPSENIKRKQKSLKIMLGEYYFRPATYNERRQIAEMTLKITSISEVTIFSIIPLNFEFLSSVTAISVTYVLSLIQFEFESLK